MHKLTDDQLQRIREQLAIAQSQLPEDHEAQYALAEIEQVVIEVETEKVMMTAPSEKGIYIF